MNYLQTLVKNNKKITTIKDDNVICYLVYNINSVGYKIHKDGLEFIF